MENREQINNVDHFVQALNLSIQIQNAGIATVFCDLSGHITRMNIRAYTPKWIPDMRPTYEFDLFGDDVEYGIERNNKVLESLSKILLTEKKDESEELRIIETQERQIRREQYEKLKKEFEPEFMPTPLPDYLS